MMESLHIKGWLIKGSYKSPSQTLSGNAWGNGVPGELKRLEALLRRAARQLNPEHARTWLRTPEQLRGHGLKATLPWRTVGVLTASEANWFATENAAIEVSYNNMLASMHPDVVSLDTARTLPDVNTRIANQLRPSALLIDNLVRGRFTAMVQGKNKRQAEAESKRPIQERINSIGLDLKLSKFNPLFIRGRPFNIPDNVAARLLEDNQEAKEQTLAQALNYCRNEQSRTLRELAIFWFRDTLGIPEAEPV